MTFEEAYRKTGRILCITLSSTTKKAPPVLVNYITAPNVTIASAVIASAGKFIDYSQSSTSCVKDYTKAIII